MPVVRLIPMILLAVLAACGSLELSTPGPGPLPAPEPGPGPRLEPLPGDDVPSPVLWTWQMPLGRAADDPSIVMIVRKFAAPGPPGPVADRVCNEILRRGLRAGEVAILLQRFGMGDGDPKEQRAKDTALFRHDDDALPPGTCSEPWMTTWMSHGIAECRTWMDGFIERYEHRQANDPRIPDPSRFHFDTELTVVPHYSKHGALEAFHHMRSDPRFTREAIPGHGGRTLDRLYRDAGGPTYDVTRSWVQGPNRAWAVWYAGVCLQACDGAMNEAAYEPIRQAWPGCKSGNYVTSASFDGTSPTRRFVSGTGHHQWFIYAHEGSGDLMSPRFYWVGKSYARAGESRADATIRWCSEMADAAIASGGGDARRFVPWILMNGFERPAEFPTVTADMTEDMLRMLRDKGVQEVILWSDDTTQRSHRPWNELVEIADRLWPNRRR